MDDRKSKIAAQLIEALPYARALGMELIRIGQGEAEITMPYAESLIGDPRTGVVHGGVVFALMDTAGGAAVMSHENVPAWTATLDLRIDYMRPATPRQRLSAVATCYHVTRTVAFVRAVARDEDGARPVATASGAFAIEAPKKETG